MTLHFIVSFLLSHHEVWPEQVRVSVSCVPLGYRCPSCSVRDLLHADILLTRLLLCFSFPVGGGLVNWTPIPLISGAPVGCIHSNHGRWRRGVASRPARCHGSKVVMYCKPPPYPFLQIQANQPMVCVCGCRLVTRQDLLKPLSSHLVCQRGTNHLINTYLCLYVKP